MNIPLPELTTEESLLLDTLQIDPSPVRRMKQFAGGTFGAETLRCYEETGSEIREIGIKFLLPPATLEKIVGWLIQMLCEELRMPVA